MKIVFVLFCYLFILFTKTTAQTIKIGDKLPNLVLNDIINYDKNELSLSSFEGKFLILDFWATNCLSCLKSFPIMDGYQKKFNDSLQIILINEQSKDSTLSFFNSRKKIKMPCVPFVTNDTILSSMFPHSSVPLYVWIDKAGIVQNISDEIISEQLVINFLENKKLDTTTYGRIQEFRSTLFESSFENQIQYFSYLSSCIDKVTIGSGLENNTDQIVANCKSVLELYIMAFNSGGKFEFNRTGRLELQLSDSLQLNQPAEYETYVKWRKKHRYNYNLKVPEHLSYKKYEIMQADLNDFFQINSSIEKKPRKSIVLISLGNFINVRSNGGTSYRKFKQFSEGDSENKILQLKNRPYSQFLSLLSGQIENSFQVPFIDETKYSGMVDIDIDLSGIYKQDLSILNLELEKYKLKLVEKICLLDVLIIK